MSMIFAKHDYIARKKKWLGVIYEQNNREILVLSLCESDTEKGVIEEIDREMKEQPWKIDA